MKVYFLFLDPPTETGKAELHAALKTLELIRKEQVVRLSPEQLEEATIESGDVLWWHWPSGTLPAAAAKPRFAGQVMSAVEDGAGLLLSLGAALLPAAAGIEAEPPDAVEAGLWHGETGPFAQRGMMAFGRHPLFNLPNRFGLNLFTWTPCRGEPYWSAAYGSMRPRRTIARGCRYLSEPVDEACLWEHSHGSGIILCVGSYLHFNARRNYLARNAVALLENCLQYLSEGHMPAAEDLHWPRRETGCREADKEYFAGLPPVHIKYRNKGGLHWMGVPSLPSNPGNNFFSCAGRRMLLTGSEGKEIGEIWSYPVRLLRELRWTLTPAGGAPERQETLYKTSTIFPSAVEHLYENEAISVREQIHASFSQPFAAIQLEIAAKTDFRLSFFFCSDLALMWPAPDGAVGKINYFYDENDNTIYIKSGAKACYCAIGLSKNPEGVIFGDESDHLKSLLRYEIRMPELGPGTHSISLSVAGGRSAEGFETGISVESGEDMARAAEHYRKLAAEILNISTPDADLDEAILWAQLRLENFRAATPDLGSALTAGFAPSGEGWLSTRPGYGWYFGRDSLWTSLGLLSAGRFNAVAETLRFLARHQAPDGKIAHEVSASGYAHYDSADANPLFLVAAERYLAWTGDGETINELLPALREALEFSFKGDYDGDGLTENTGVGHGWIEGGDLFGAHVTFYLAGLWLRALESAKILFEGQADSVLIKKIESYAGKVREALTSRFWDSEKGTYYYGLLEDGSMNRADTIMPAAVILFGDTDPKRDVKFLRRASGPDIVTDWGARMISEFDNRYDPEGYHTGSVWPLYTGWLGLAQYARGRSLQGYELLRAGAANYAHFSAGCFSEALRGDVYQQWGVCPQQAWSAALLLWLLTKGLLGIEPAAGGRLWIRPDMPPHWLEARVENIVWRGERIGICYSRRGLEVTYLLSGIRKGKPVAFAPLFPRGAGISGVRLNSDEISPAIGVSFGRPQLIIDLDGMEGEVKLEVKLHSYLSPLPALVPPRPGKGSEGFRIIGWGHHGGIMRVELMGKSGTENELGIIDPGNLLAESESLTRREAELKFARFSYPDSTKPYSRTTLSFAKKPEAE